MRYSVAALVVLGLGGVAHAEKPVEVEIVRQPLSGIEVQGYSPGSSRDSGLAAGRALRARVEAQRAPAQPPPAPGKWEQLFTMPMPQGTAYVFVEPTSLRSIGNARIVRWVSGWLPYVAAGWQFNTALISCDTGTIEPTWPSGTVDKPTQGQNGEAFLRFACGPNVAQR